MAEVGKSKVGASDSGKSRRHPMVLRRELKLKRPRHPLNFGYDGNPKIDLWPLAELALSTFNEKTTGTKYELERVRKGVKQFRPPSIHFNLVGRPDDGSDANKLFFAEMRWVGPSMKDYTCTCCCIIGHPRTVTGLSGCRFLCKEPPYHRRVQHPKDGNVKWLGMPSTSD